MSSSSTRRPAGSASSELSEWLVRSLRSSDNDLLRRAMLLIACDDLDPKNESLTVEELWAGDEISQAGRGAGTIARRGERCDHA